MTAPEIRSKTSTAEPRRLFTTAKNANTTDTKVFLMTAILIKLISQKAKRLVEVGSHDHRD